jgi:hypothetical protein
LDWQGNHPGIVRNCYATGDVSSASHNINIFVGTGGIVGISQDSSIVENCYATGRVTNSRNNTGGLVGGISDRSSLTNKGSVLRNSVALNQTITQDENNFFTIGRVVGHKPNEFMSRLVNNYAYSGMTVVRGTTNKTIDPGLQKLDGENITAVQYNNQSWWQTTGNWSTSDGATAWDFTNVWQWGSNNLPILRHVGGNQ